LGQAIIGPGAFGIALDQPGIGQKLEMSRHARLALLEDFGEVLDRMVALGEQGKQPQAGVFTRGLQHAHQFCQISQSNRPKSDIKMSLYPVEAKVQRVCALAALNVPMAARRPLRQGSCAAASHWYYSRLRRSAPGSLRCCACGRNGRATAGRYRR